MAQENLPDPVRAAVEKVAAIDSEARTAHFSKRLHRVSVRFVQSRWWCMTRQSARGTPPHPYPGKYLRG